MLRKLGLFEKNYKNKFIIFVEFKSLREKNTFTKKLPNVQKVTCFLVFEIKICDLVFDKDKRT